MLQTVINAKIKNQNEEPKEIKRNIRNVQLFPRTSRKLEVVRHLNQRMNHDTPDCEILTVQCELAGTALWLSLQMSIAVTRDVIDVPFTNSQRCSQIATALRWYLDCPICKHLLNPGKPQRRPFRSAPRTRKYRNRYKWYLRSLQLAKKKKSKEGRTLHTHAPHISLYAVLMASRRRDGK